jgi:hypothetical protein
MIFEVVVLGALVLYLIVDFFTYKKLEFLLMNHNVLLLYHIHFLRGKYEDYGQPVEHKDP